MKRISIIFLFCCIFADRSSKSPLTLNKLPEPLGRTRRDLLLLHSLGLIINIKHYIIMHNSKETSEKLSKSIGSRLSLKHRVGPYRTVCPIKGGPNGKFPFFILRHFISTSWSLIKEWGQHLRCVLFELVFASLGWTAIGWCRSGLIAIGKRPIKLVIRQPRHSSSCTHYPAH